MHAIIINEPTATSVIPANVAIIIFFIVEFLLNFKSILI